MSTTESFFQNLAVRYYHENDLSNITWALCQASKTFMRLWMQFFFEGFDIETIREFHRELPDEKSGDSRADFVIYVDNSNTPYVIEVKIGDRGHHFQQYINAYSIDEAHLGYIVNYPWKEEGFEVKQWKEFYDHLIKQDIPEDEQALINGYCDYLKRVCHMAKAENLIDLEKMSSLYDLVLLFTELVDNETDIYHSVGYDTKWRATPNSRREYMEVRYKDAPDSWKRVWPCIGLWYDNYSPRIGVKFENEAGWGKPVYEFIKKNIDKCHPGKYCSVPSLLSNKSGALFELSSFAKDEFNNAKDIDQQRTILKSFLDEVLQYPVVIYKSC